jgi:hypothetical protein
VPARLERTDLAALDNLAQGGVEGRAVSTIMCSAVTIRTQTRDPTGVIWSIVRQPADVIHFQIGSTSGVMSHDPAGPGCTRSLLPTGSLPFLEPLPPLVGDLPHAARGVVADHPFLSLAVARPLRRVASARCVRVTRWVYCKGPCCVWIWPSASRASSMLAKYLSLLPGDLTRKPAPRA